LNTILLPPLPFKRFSSPLVKLQVKFPPVDCPDIFLEWTLVDEAAVIGVEFLGCEIEDFF
jgi:hypothetical protein